MAGLKEIISEDSLRSRVEAMSGEIASAMESRDFVMIGVLKGSVVFLADLMRALHRRNTCPLVDFVTISSYGEETESSGAASVLSGPHMDLSGLTVLLVDDIADTGVTLQQARDIILAKGAGRVYTCVLLDKPARRKVDFKPDFHGFSIDDYFVVGYGLDAANRHRCLPFIARMEIK